MGNWMINISGIGPTESVAKKLASFIIDLKKDSTDVSAKHVHGTFVAPYVEPVAKQIKFYLNGKERYIEPGKSLTYNDLIKMSNVLLAAVGSVEFTQKNGPVYRMMPNESMMPYEGQVISVNYRE